MRPKNLFVHRLNSIGFRLPNTRPKLSRVSTAGRRIGVCACARFVLGWGALWLLLFVFVVTVEVVQVMGFGQSVPHEGERDACTPSPTACSHKL